MLQINLRCINTKVRSLGTVGLCYQLQKENVPMAVALNCCSKACAWSITCCMSHTPHLLSPPSQLKWVPAHMLGWLAAGPGDLGPRTEHPLCCSKCYIIILLYIFRHGITGFKSPCDNKLLLSS